MPNYPTLGASLAPSLGSQIAIDEESFGFLGHSVPRPYNISTTAGASIRKVKNLICGSNWKKNSMRKIFYQGSL